MDIKYKDWVFDLETLANVIENPEDYMTEGDTVHMAVPGLMSSGDQDYEYLKETEILNLLTGYYVVESNLVSESGRKDVVHITKEGRVQWFGISQCTTLTSLFHDWEIVSKIEV